MALPSFCMAHEIAEPAFLGYFVVCPEGTEELCAHEVAEVIAFHLCGTVATTAATTSSRHNHHAADDDGEQQQQQRPQQQPASTPTTVLSLLIQSASRSSSLGCDWTVTDVMPRFAAMDGRRGRIRGTLFVLPACTAQSLTTSTTTDNTGDTAAQSPFLTSPSAPVLLPPVCVEELVRLRSNEQVGLLLGCWTDCDAPSDVRLCVSRCAERRSTFAAVAHYRTAFRGLKAFAPPALVSTTSAAASASSTTEDRSSRVDDDDEPVSFKVEAVRLDKHARAFNSQQIATDAGFVIGAEHEADGWKVSLVFSNTVFVCRHDSRTLLFGLQLHRVNYPRMGADVSVVDQIAMESKRRSIGVRLHRGDTVLDDVKSFPHPTHFKHDIRRVKGLNSMHPAIAHWMARTADVGPTDVVLDPMAGSGTTLLECGLLPWPKRPRGGETNTVEGRYAGCAIGLAGDLTVDDCVLQYRNFLPSEVDLALRGHALMGGGDNYRVHSEQLGGGNQWDAQRLPLRPGCIDVVLCDMPFGQRCGNKAINGRLYPPIMEEIRRVLRPPEGRALILSTEHELLCQLLGVLPDVGATRRDKAGDGVVAPPSATATSPWRLLRPVSTVDMNGIKPFVFFVTPF